MSSPQGTWNVVTNLSNSVLNITGVDEAQMTGTIEVEPSVTYDVAGTWTGNEVNFSYSYPLKSLPPIADAGRQAQAHEVVEPSGVGTIVRSPVGPPVSNSVQFSGYIFQAGKPLFNEAPGPTSAAWNMMAGTWTGSDSVGGWTARSQQPLSD
jgi:hypothetical protein